VSVCLVLPQVEADKEYSVCETRSGYTDFAKVKFTITTTEGAAVTIAADRCGGNNSQAIVTADGAEVCTTITPDAELEAKVEKQMAAEPEVMSYFWVQHDDYVELKSRVAAHTLSGAPGTPVHSTPPPWCCPAVCPSKIWSLS